ncbi:hypothetical protein KJ636_02635, partial [Patescibacteria group bacterium]|nr:hypothetical protein [Patescibacteria group bacterium]
MNNLLRKIIVSGVILSLGVVALPALAAISAECKADLTKCNSAELTEYITELTARLTALQAQVATVQPTTPTTPTATTYAGIPAGFTFEKNLKLGTRDADVVNLKYVLDVEVPDHAAWTGSNYFASKTKAAVIKFQQKYSADISATAGYTIAASG